MNSLIGKKHITATFVMPDISTKAKAQTYLGIDMKKEEVNKEKFLKTVVPQWLQKAKENGIYVSQNMK